MPQVGFRKYGAQVQGDQCEDYSLKGSFLYAKKNPPQRIPVLSQEDRCLVSWRRPEEAEAVSLICSPDHRCSMWRNISSCDSTEAFQNIQCSKYSFNRPLDACEVAWWLSVVCFHTEGMDHAALPAGDTDMNEGPGGGT